MPLLSGTSVLPPSVASAQVNDPNAEARVFFDRGNRLLERADRARGARQRALLEDALEAFVSTVRIVRSRNAIFNAGLVLTRLERPAEAFGYFREYLAIDGLSAQERTDGEARIAELRQHVAVLRVASAPAGAQVFVDRLDLAPRGTTPLEVALPPGAHVVYLRAPHHADFRVETNLVLGEATEVQGRLVPEPVTLIVEVPPASSGTGTLSLDGAPIQPGPQQVSPGEHEVRLEASGRPTAVRHVVLAPGEDGRVSITLAPLGQARLRVASIEGAEVRVDGRLVGQGEVDIEVDPGPHEVDVRAPGHARYVAPVETRAGATTNVAVRLGAAGQGTRLGALPHVALGVTAAAAAVTVGLMVRALRLKDDFEDACPGGTVSQCTSMADDVDRANHLADGILGAAAALAITTLILYLVNSDAPDEPSEADVQFGLAPTRNGGVATLGGTF